jgi:squalene synthase HpnC
MPPPGLPTPGEVLGRAAGENFAVASRVLPARARRHLMAFYGFARFTDQLGDAYAGDRIGALDWLEAETRRALAGTPGTHPLVGPAARSVLALGIDGRPLFDLIEANRLDQTVRSYAGFDDLLGYCALSAAPVGRLVLGAFAVDEPKALTLSDDVCNALQLVEHWQDVAEDARAGRVYVPGEDLGRFGVDPAVLAGPGPAPGPLRALMAFECARARRLLDQGTPLVAMLRGRARVAVAGFVAGGRAALDDLARRDFDVLTAPSRPRAAAVGRHLLLILARRDGRRK